MQCTAWLQHTQILLALDFTGVLLIENALGSSAPASPYSYQMLPYCFLFPSYVGDCLLNMSL